MTGIKYWMALSRVQGIGPVNLNEIYRAVCEPGLSAEDLFECTQDEIISDFHLSRKMAEAADAAKLLLEETEETFLALGEAGINVLPFFDSAYPERIRSLLPNTFPPFLYVLGDVSILKEPGIAVLGDSSVSPAGESITSAAARDFAARRIVTVSGLAQGADLTAHRSALVNGGKTAAVIPCGINFFKPPESMASLMTVDNTVIISPFYPSVKSDRFNAFTRNRIICAMSKAVFIVEAPEEGGIFEAAKSACKLRIPLYTVKYGEYPENAKGNRIILENLGGIPVMRRKDREGLEPNTDHMAAQAGYREKA